MSDCFCSLLVSNNSKDNFVQTSIKGIIGCSRTGRAGGSSCVVHSSIHWLSYVQVIALIKVILTIMTFKGFT